MIRYASINENDPINTQNKRNIRNSDKDNYNCAGYALGTFNWYVPYDDDNKPYPCTDETIDRMVKYMIEDFQGRLRVIDNENETQIDEICIAFRASSHDFHYAKRGKNNQWRHKMGNDSYIDYMTKQELYSVDGWHFGKYSSKIIFMALKKS